MQPPSPHRQRLQLQRRRPDEAPESYDAEDNAEDVDDVVAWFMSQQQPEVLQIVECYEIGVLGKTHHPAACYTPRRHRHSGASRPRARN